jgi:nitrogen regulatory protein PII
MQDFEQFTLVDPAVLVTIVSETILKDSLIMLLTKLKVRSYTVSQVQGAGRTTRRSAAPNAEGEAGSSEMVETNLEIKAIVSQELSNVILYALKEQQRDFVIFVYRQPVEVLIEE